MRRGGVAAFVAAATLVLAACSPGSGDDAATVTLLTQPQTASSAPVVSVVDPAYGLRAGRRGPFLVSGAQHSPSPCQGEGESSCLQGSTCDNDGARLLACHN